MLNLVLHQSRQGQEAKLASRLTENRSVVKNSEGALERYEQMEG